MNKTSKFFVQCLFCFFLNIDCVRDTKDCRIFGVHWSWNSSFTGLLFNTYFTFQYYLIFCFVFIFKLFVQRQRSCLDLALWYFLINAVLANLPTYYLSMFCIPVTIAKKMEQIMCRLRQKRCSWFSYDCMGQGLPVKEGRWCWPSGFLVFYSSFVEIMDLETKLRWRVGLFYVAKNHYGKVV